MKIGFIRIITMAAATALALSLTGCGGSGNTAHISASREQIVVAGSTTVAPVAQAMADAFMEIHTQYNVEVQSMGTGAGMIAAIEGVADIGIASRNLNADELTTLDFITFAIDGIAIAVHASNPVKDLSFDDIRSIFLGEITNWSEVGGNNAEIIVVSREAGSGARSSFESLAGVTDDVAYMLIGIGSNGVLTSVDQNVNAVGYAAYGLVAGRNTSAIAVDGISFSNATAIDGSYPFAIGFHMAFPSTGVSASTQVFLDWVMSPAGQAVVADYNYLPVAHHP